MVSFSQLWEAMETGRTSPLMDSGDEGHIVQIMQAGKDLRKEDESQFWDEFMTLCSNAKGLSELLDVGQEKVRSWPAKIKEALDKLAQHHVESPNKDVDTEMVPTGTNGAVTVNQDPYLGEM